MQSKQRNQQFMGDSVKGTLNSNATVWNSSPIVTTAVNQHQTNLTEIRMWQVKQQIALTVTGLTRNKKILRDLIILDLMKFIGGIKAYGASSGQWNIVDSVNYSESELGSMSATNFLTAAQNVHDVATTNAPALIPYAITGAMITTLQADITGFNTANTRGKQARAEAKTATENLSLACKNMMSHLTNVLDNLLKQWISIPFYSEYRNSRKIYNYNSDTTGIRGRISDASNGEVIKNGLLELVFTGRSEPLTINNRGEYHRKKLELTSCTLRIRVPHYLAAEYDVPLKKNETTIFDFQMVPEPLATVNTSSNPNRTVAAQ